MQFLTISENILLFISCFGVLQGLLLSGLLYFHKRSDHSVNKFLSLYITCLSIIMAGPLMLKLLPWQQTFFIEPFTYLVGPLMYLYIRSFREKITWKRALPHMTAFFLYFFISFAWVSYLANKYNQSVNIPVEGFRSPIAVTLLIVRYSQLLLYYFLSRKELKLYQHSIRQVFSETSRIDLKWVSGLVNGYLFLVITTIVLMPLMVSFPQHFDLLYLINIVVATPYIYITTYKGVMQPTIWQAVPTQRQSSVEEELQEAVIVESVAKADQPSSLTRESADDEKRHSLAKRVKRLMEAEHLYREPELTLQQLADRLEAPSYQVSIAINEDLNRTFYDLVNGYRVEDAKRLLLEEDSINHTILSVGFEAGFNSKTTFNTVFKKYTGQTPTEFRQRQRAVSLSMS